MKKSNLVFLIHSKGIFKAVLSLFFVSVCLVSHAQVITTIAGNGTGAFSGDGGPATAASMHVPQGIIFDTSGDIFFADFENNRIRKIDATGIITTIAGTGVAGYTGDGIPAVSSEINMPTGLAIDTFQNIYITDYGNSRIRKINTAGIISTVAGTGVPGFSGDGGAATDAQLCSPYYIVFDKAGNLLIADRCDNRIRRINTSGIISTIAGGGSAGDGAPATDAYLASPTGVAVDTAGNVYIADLDNFSIRKVNTSGIISTIAGTGTPGYSGDGGPATDAEINYPYEISTDDLGNVFIADQINNRIRVINSAGIINNFAGTGVLGFSGDGGPATAAEFYKPWLMVKDKPGNYYIVDQDNNRIRKIACVVPSAGIITGLSSICSGSYLTLTDTLPGKWASSDTVIARVDSVGMVIGLAYGVATISFSATNSCGTSMAVKTITVNPLPHSGIISGADSVCAGDSIILTDTSGGGIWSSAHVAVASVSISGTVTGVVGGNDTIMYVVSNSCGSDTTKFPVTVRSAAFCSAGITAISNPAASLIDIYPNPSHGTFTISLRAGTTDDTHITITNLIGEKITEFTVPKTEKERVLHLDVARGIYFLTAVAGTEVMNTKIVVQ